jgi:uncharacterized protein YbcI
MASTDTTIAGSKAAEISNMVVRVTSQYTGRGPTKARTMSTMIWSPSSCRTR